MRLRTRTRRGISERSGERLQVDVGYIRLDVRAIPFGVDLWLVKRDDVHAEHTLRSHDLAGTIHDRSSWLRRPRSRRKLRVTPDAHSGTHRDVDHHAGNSTEPAHG